MCEWNKYQKLGIEWLDRASKIRVRNPKAQNFLLNQCKVSQTCLMKSYERI